MLVKAVDRCVTDKVEHVKEAIKYYESVWAKKSWDSLNVARKEAELCQRIGEIDSVILWLERARQYREAVELAEEKGDIEKVIQLYERGVEYLKGLNHYVDAVELANSGAEFCKRHRHLEKAVGLYKRVGKGHMIAEMAEQAKKKGEIERAVDLYEAAGSCSREDTAAELYYKRAGHLAWQKLGDIERAVIDFAMYGQNDSDHSDLTLAPCIAGNDLGYERALQLAEEIEDRDKKHKFLRDLGKHAERKGQIEVAIQIFEKADLYDCCAKLAEQKGDFERALHYCEKEISYLEEHNWRGIGKWVKYAAELAEKNGQIEKAKAYRMLNESLYS